MFIVVRVSLSPPVAMSPVYPDEIKTGNWRTGKHLPTISESEVEVSAFPTGLAALSSVTEEAVDGYPSSGDFRLAGKGDVSRLPESVASIGSLKHPHCTPCIFMALKASGSKSTLCSAGAECEYCHFPHPMTKKDLLKRLRSKVEVGSSELHS